MFTRLLVTVVSFSMFLALAGISVALASTHNYVHVENAPIEHIAVTFILSMLSFAVFVVCEYKENN